MKIAKRTLILSLILVFVLSCSVQAGNANQQKAIRKQIKILETGIKNHNLKQIKKVVKKPYSSYCDFSRIDRLVGKDFLKHFSDSAYIKVKHIDVYGNTANVTIDFQLCDCSTLYFQTHKNLKLNHIYYKENFKKELYKVMGKYKEKDLLVCGLIGNSDYTVTMVKRKGKWFFDKDPDGTFFDMYSCGYFYFACICGNMSFNDW